MDIEQVRKLAPKDGDIFVLPSNTTIEFAEELKSVVRSVYPDIQAYLVIGDIEQLSEADMNAAGRYRA